MTKDRLMRADVTTFTTPELVEAVNDLNSLEGALREAMRASDACETWAYYGRSSREELPGVQLRRSVMMREIRRRTV
jgi:hypothetical protein